MRAENLQLKNAILSSLAPPEHNIRSASIMKLLRLPLPSPTRLSGFGFSVPSPGPPFRVNRMLFAEYGWKTIAIAFSLLATVLRPVSSLELIFLFSSVVNNHHSVSCLLFGASTHRRCRTNQEICKKRIGNFNKSEAIDNEGFKIEACGSWAMLAPRPAQG